jgi:hypothetical protein
VSEDPLLTVRCPRRRCAVAWVVPTPQGPWVECAAVGATPRGLRDAVSAVDDTDAVSREVADAVRREGHYPAESGPLSVGPSDAIAQIVADVAASLTPLMRAEYESLRAPDYMPSSAFRARERCRSSPATRSDTSLRSA